MSCRPLLLLALLAAAPALALDGDVPGLDVLLLVDRSGSMSSNHRRIENALLDLTLTMLARSAREEGVRHRLGVVSFGSAARVDIPMTAVEDSTLPATRSALLAVDSRRSLGNTNFPAAFDAAADAFAAISSEPPRRRAILLITDGRAYVPGVPRSEGISSLHRSVSAKLSPPVSIDALMFGSGADAAAWRHLPRTRIHDLANDRGAALAALHRIVSDLLGTPGQQREIEGALDTVDLPPYLDLVVFDILHGPSGNDVSVFAPGARQPLDSHTPSVEDVRLGDAFSTVAIRRPAAGKWTFRKTDAAARVRVLAQQFFPRGVLVGPDPSSLLRQHDQVVVAYRLLDTNGGSFQELANYPLSVDVVLAMPDGRRVALPMKHGIVLGLYRTSTAADCDVAGRYWTEVGVTTADAGGRPVRVFEDRWSGFAVHSADRIDCRLRAPALGDRVRVECMDGRDRPADLRRVVTEASASPFLAILQHDGKRVAQEIQLQYQGSGIFEGTLPTVAPGTYALQMMVDSSRVPTMLNVRIHPASVTFVRPQKQPVPAAVLAVATAASAVAVLALLRIRKLYVARRQARTA